MRPRASRKERGAALLVVMVAVAVLTALAVDLAYDSRVSLRIAANARDELRASYLARSGVALSRVVLSFQQMVDETNAAVPAGTGAVQAPRFQIWRMIPVGSSLVSSLFPGSGTPPSASAAPTGAAPTRDAAFAAGGARTAGRAAVAPGGFEATIDDEGRKVNAQFEGLARTSDKKLWQQVAALYQTVCDARWDPLFDREDARGVRTSREDLLVRLRDWVDSEHRSSALRATFGGTSCSMVLDPVPFEEGFGDPNQPYDRGDDRYRTKNARMDSLDELYLVAGVGDAFMAAFGDALTVYLPRDGAGAKRNVNELDAQRLVELAKIIADPPLQPALLDPLFAERLQKLVVQQTFMGVLSLSPSDFGRLVLAAGVLVNMNLLQDAQANPFTDRSSTFRIRSTGAAGDVTATVDAVVRIETAQAGEPVGAPGRLIHWREE